MPAVVPDARIGFRPSPGPTCDGVPDRLIVVFGAAALESISVCSSVGSDGSPCVQHTAGLTGSSRQAGYPREVQLQHEHLYRLAVEQVADYAIFLVDPRGRAATWNAGVRHLLRWDEADWIGQPLSVIFPPEDVANGDPEAELETARRNGSARDDRWHVRRDGTKLWCGGVTTALRDDRGSIVGFLKVMRDLTDQKRAEERQATQLAVMSALAEAPGLEDAVPKLLQAVCTASGWRWGGLWAPARPAGVLRLLDLWHDPSDPLAGFEQLSRGITFAPGVGLPGRVWAAGTPEWVTDVSSEGNFPRKDAASRAGLRGALCFPVAWRGEVLAVIEFFSGEIRPPDEPLLGMLAVVGGQIGQFIDRKLTEERLRAEEARHAAVVQTALDCIVGMDHDGRVTEWNPAAERTFGYSRDEALGRDMADLIIPQVLRGRHRQGLGRYLATGEGPVVGSRFEITALRKDGGEFPVELSITRVPAPGPPAFTGYLRDITGRKNAEAALRESEERLRAVFQQTEAGIAQVDLTGRFVLANERYGQIVGRPLRELMALRMQDITHPDDLPRNLQLLERSVREGTPFVIEKRYVRPDGSEVWVSNSVSLTRGRDGVPNGVVAATVDITDRRRAEEALRESEQHARRIIDNTLAFIGVMTPDGTLTEANATALRAGGLRREDVVGRKFWDCYWWSYDPRVQDRLKDAVASAAAGEVVRYDVVVRMAGDSRMPIDFMLSPVRDGQGSVTHLIPSGMEITERKRAEEERQALLEAEQTARAGAERASRMKDEFLATLSHELRTPLNAILGWSQILAGGSRDEEDLAEGLRVIERNARAQTRIIEDLLDMSRIISGKVRLDVQRVDLAELVRLAVETAKPSADAKGVRLQAVLDPGTGPVSGDPNRLQQVFWNLLSNAVKFTPRGGRVQVLLERVNSHVEVAVIDTGEGIGPEFLPHVFDRFRQADATTTRRHGGLGLGLSIVKQLVELHGGSVRVKSPGVGRGATFTVSLPLTVIHPEPNPDVERRHPRGTSASAAVPDACVQISGVKVLVVDDEPDARSLVKRLLEDCQGQVVTAANASEALELVRTQRPDVLVCDIGMPGEDGYALIRRVRALGPDNGGNVPAAALTAYARAEDRVKAVLAGFQMHLAKPVEPAELIATVASLAGLTGNPRGPA